MSTNLLRIFFLLLYTLAVRMCNVIFVEHACTPLFGVVFCVDVSVFGTDLSSLSLLSAFATDNSAVGNQTPSHLQAACCVQIRSLWISLLVPVFSLAANDKTKQKSCRSQFTYNCSLIDEVQYVCISS